MSKATLSQLWRYALAVGTVALAAALTLFIYFLNVRLRFAFFYAAVIVATRYGGRRPGLLAIFLSIPVSDYLFVEPQYHWSHDIEGIGLLAVFVGVALLIWELSVKRSRAEEELHRRERELT
ncbi:MAG: hypothetical protein QOF61_2330, partial [Acidobacteriota bacterium]|nr:hypothetical protein [Acidobacteriota bacterium]